MSVGDNATKITSTHASAVCRALATAIIWTHLKKFQRAILDVEKGILQKNPSFVGAYNIVPLSGVLGAFDGWSRKLQWLLSLVNYIREGPAPRREVDIGTSCTAVQAIKWLRDSANTGYPDIEQLSLQLIQVAETTWLRSLCACVLYGKLPTLAASDFLVHRKMNGGEPQGAEKGYKIVPKLIPYFVTQSSASSILFIGRSLNHIRNRGPELGG